ncbi:hypothetical protein L3C95_30045 [Chitinophaga filiformis]|uniref:hypothetical protein n=1 Tax=Chitinophaga filiformis TaxID=104663 RepID=UPI001F459511|nr:hypothetical protein [Chitinophaga filiformis]MCF6407176.1 hypothetical protein [Chitinophaga filiformis]
MKAAEILESGLTGAATITLLSKTLGSLNPKTPDVNLFNKKGIVRRIKRNIHKNGFKAVKGYVKLAGQLLSMAGAMGLAGFGKKKNAALTGAMLGALSGTAVAFLQNKPDEETEEKDLWTKRLVTIVLYILGGLVAGKAMKYFSKKSKNKS